VRVRASGRFPPVLGLQGETTLERVALTGDAEINVPPMARAEARDVRISGFTGGGHVFVRGELDAEDWVVEGVAPRVTVDGDGRLVGRGVALLATPDSPPVSFTVGGRAGAAELEAARLRNVGVLVNRALTLRDVALSSDAGRAPDVVTVLGSSTPGDPRARIELSRVTAERTAFRLRAAVADFVDFAAKGEELLRVDPRTPEEVDVVSRYVGIVADTSSVTLTRTAFVDVPAVLAGRRAFSATVVDALVSRTACEPFAFGPGPIRQGLDQVLRGGRPCENLLYDADYPYPHPLAEYAERFAVKLERVWVRSAGLAGPFRNELQVVGDGALDVDDLNFTRTTSRGLLVQGPVALDVRRAVFAEPGIQGACFFPAVRLEPTMGVGVGPSDPTGILDGVLSDGMDVGFAQLLGVDIEPDLVVRNYVVRGAEQGIFRARASDRTFAVPFDIEDFLVRNALVDVDDLQGATPNESCD
jgi:hypothetical protein